MPTASEAARLLACTPAPLLHTGDRMSREQLFAGFFFAVFLYLLYQFYYVFHFFIGPLSWAALLALVFHPLQRRLVRLLRQREGLAAFLLTTAVILIVIVPTIYLTVMLARQSVELYRDTREAFESGRIEDLIHQVRDSSIGHLWDKLVPQFALMNIDLRAIALSAANSVSGFLATQVPEAAANLLHFVIDFFLTTFALFFFFRDGERMVRGVRDVIPMEPEHKDVVLARFYETISAVVQGTLVTALAQGVLAGLGYALLGVPFSLILACATALFALLPVGSPVVWLSVAAYLGITGAYGRMVAMLVWGGVVVASVDNVLRPLIIGGRTQIPTVFLFFAILGGLQAYGLLGVFLAPALIAILVAFVRIYREQYRPVSQ